MGLLIEKGYWEKINAFMVKTTVWDDLRNIKSIHTQIKQYRISWHMMIFDEAKV